MVAQVRANAGDVTENVDAMLRKLLVGPDPRAHEDAGRLQRPGGEDDELAPDRFDYAIGLDFDSYGTTVLNDDAAGERVRAYRQVRAGTGGGEVTDGGGDAKPTDLVHRVGPGAPPGGIIRVLAVGVAEFVGRSEPRLVDPGQFVVAGEPLAVMGEKRVASVNALTLETDKPTLYIEFRKNGKPVDSRPWWSAKNSGKARNDT